MLTEKKSMDFLYYISLLDEEEFEKDKEKLIVHVRQLPIAYREVYYYITGEAFRISKNAQKIYKKLLEK